MWLLIRPSTVLFSYGRGTCRGELQTNTLCNGFTTSVVLWWKHTGKSGGIGSIRIGASSCSVEDRYARGADGGKAGHKLGSRVTVRGNQGKTGL